MQQGKKSRCVWVAVGWVVRLSWTGRQVWLGNAGRKKGEIVRSGNFNLKMRGEMQEEEFQGGEVRKMAEPYER